MKSESIVYHCSDSQFVGAVAFIKVKEEDQETQEHYNKTKEILIELFGVTDEFNEITNVGYFPIGHFYHGALRSGGKFYSSHYGFMVMKNFRKMGIAKELIKVFTTKHALLEKIYQSRFDIIERLIKEKKYEIVGYVNDEGIDSFFKNNKEYLAHKKTKDEIVNKVRILKLKKEGFFQKILGF